LNTPPDDRAAFARAMELATLVTTIGLEMVVPSAIGYWLDQRLGSKPAFTVLGVVLGMTVGIWHAIRLGAELAGKSGNRGDREEEESPPDSASTNTSV
jgi:F0F1-type ATP synthase assembly protein I